MGEIKKNEATLLSQLGGISLTLGYLFNTIEALIFLFDPHETKLTDL